MADSAVRIQMGSSIKMAWLDPKVRDKYIRTQKAARKKQWASATTREKHIAALKTLWNDPDYRQKQIAAIKAGIAARAVRLKSKLFR